MNPKNPAIIAAPILWSLKKRIPTPIPPAIPRMKATTVSAIYPPVADSPSLV